MLRAAFHSAVEMPPNSSRRRMAMILPACDFESVPARLTLDLVREGRELEAAQNRMFPSVNASTAEELTRTPTLSFPKENVWPQIGAAATIAAPVMRRTDGSGVKSGISRNPASKRACLQIVGLTASDRRP